MAALFYVFASLADAQAAQAVVDTACGYPKPGTNVGGGVHLTPTFATLHHAAVMPHPPSMTRWAHVADDVSVAALDASPLASSLPAPEALDSTWTPTTVLP